MDEQCQFHIIGFWSPHIYVFTRTVTYIYCIDIRIYMPVIAETLLVDIAKMKLYDSWPTPKNMYC